MSLDPTQLDAFRKALHTLWNEHNISSQKLLDLVAADRQQKKLPALAIARATLDRFKANKEIRKPDELEDIQTFLTSHRRYGYLFRTAAGATADIPPEVGFARALSGFFMDKSTTHHFENLRAQSPGNYVMYRPCWRASPSDGLLQTSRVEIEDAPHGLKIAEIQDFPPGNNWEYYQRDEGFMFPFCNYIYFVIKETDGAPDQSSVKFGVINWLIWPARRNIQSFRGVLYAASNLGIYPAAKFYCRRVQQETKSEVIRIADVHDIEIRNYLTEPILTTTARPI
jgi:hypothetical protein